MVRIAVHVLFAVALCASALAQPTKPAPPAAPVLKPPINRRLDVVNKYLAAEKKPPLQMLGGVPFTLSALTPSVAGKGDLVSVSHGLLSVSIDASAGVGMHVLNATTERPPPQFPRETLATFNGGRIHMQLFAAVDRTHLLECKVDGPGTYLLWVGPTKSETQAVDGTALFVFRGQSPRTMLTLTYVAPDSSSPSWRFLGCQVTQVD